MAFRKGDKVSIAGIIKHDEGDNGRVFVRIEDHHEDLWLKTETLKLIQPHFAVDDKCSFNFTNREGTDVIGVGHILAISDGHAWIDMGGGEYCTRTLTSIERVDEDLIP